MILLVGSIVEKKKKRERENKKDGRDRARALGFTSVLEFTTSKLFFVTLDIQGGMFKRERRREEKLSFVDNKKRKRGRKKEKRKRERERKRNVEIREKILEYASEISR